MNANEMLDYAFGQLEGSALAAASRELEAGPGLAERLQRLNRGLERLLDDGEAPSPPPDLARRALLLVAESRRRRRTILDFVPVAVPFQHALFS